MLIVAGYAKLAPGDTEKMETAGRIMVAETLKEEGCRIYCFARDVSEPNVFRIFELWDDQAALDAHMASPHMAEFQKVLGAVTMEGAEINIYEVSGTRPLMGG